MIFVPCTSGFVSWCSRNSCELRLVDFQPHLYFHLGGLCPTKQTCASSHQWWETQKWPLRLSFLLGIYLVSCFFTETYFWGSWVSVPLQGLMEHQLTVKLLVSFLWQNQGAVPFILELSSPACLVSEVFATDSGKRGQEAPLLILFHHIHAHVASHNCPSYKLIGEVMKCNFKMKHDLKTNKKMQQKEICLIFFHFPLVSTDYF